MYNSDASQYWHCLAIYFFIPVFVLNVSVILLMPKVEPGIRTL